MNTQQPRTRCSNIVIVGMVCAALLLIGVGGSMGYIRVASAVVAPATVVVRGNAKSIQHLDGGIVQNIAVSNGELVETGDLLLRLDDTLLRAELAIYRNRLREALAIEARLLAELDDVATVITSKVRDVAVEPVDLTHALSVQQRLFDARRTLRAGRVKQLSKKMAQLHHRARGVNHLIVARRAQLSSVRKELEALRAMRQRDYVSEREVWALERFANDYRAQMAELRAESALIHNAIGEVEVQVQQVKQEHQNEVLTQLPTVKRDIDDLLEQAQASETKLSRVVVRAPVTGLVHELSLHTIGGVLPAGAAVAQIIPLEAGTEIEARVPIDAIDRVAVDQAARVRFPAFSRGAVPDVGGKVAMISPTSVFDEGSGESFYRVRIELLDAELAKLGSHALMPGMPVEAFIVDAQHTILAYLVQPLRDYFTKALRER